MARPRDVLPGAPHAAVAVAAGEAHRAAATARVTVREATDEQTARLVASAGEDVWGPGGTLAPAELQALAFAGNPVHLALDATAALAGRPDDTDQAVLGFAIGFLGWSPGLHVHSHQTAVLPGARRRGIGLALKLAQRQTCLERGIDEMRWTFDPLVRRNAAFNLHALGARAVSFHVDFYGAMSDTVNAGDRSDRLLAVWDLRQLAPPSTIEPRGPVLLEEREGRPVMLDAPPTAGAVIAVPHDYESIRSTDPTLSLEWRMTVRQVISSSYDAGLKIVALAPTGYVLADGNE